MRVPDNLFTNRTLMALRDRRQQYADAQNVALTGRKAVRPSDDPIAMSRVRKYEDDGRRADQHERSQTLATSRLQIVDNAIGEVESMMSRAREIATQSINSSLTAQDRQALAAEVFELREHLNALAATREGEEYVFSGVAHDVPALDASGFYQGSDVIQEVEVAPGMRVPLGVSGRQVFKNPNGSAHQALSDLATALSNNDQAGMRDALGQVINAGNAVTDTRAQVGAYMTSLDIAESVSSRNALQAQENMVREVGADPFQAFAELTQAQTALAAAVEIASQLPVPGLASR